MALDHSDHGKRVNDFTLFPYRESPDAPLRWQVLYLVGPNKPNNLYNAYVDETSYGCAESGDLTDWDILPRAFGTPKNRKAFDGYAIWTMCVLDRDEILKSPHFADSENDIPFHFRLMFYTGVDSKQTQRVGLASYTYIEGQKHPKWIRLNDGQPVIEADENYYETTGRMGWRDPYVVYDENTEFKGEKGCFVMFIAAKDKNFPNDRNGCIGVAKSLDLVHWECQKPILSPGMYDEMECPVPFKIGGRHYLMSSITDPKRPEDSLRVHYWMANDYLGQYEYMGTLTDTCHYAARIVEDEQGNFLFLHTEWEDVADENDVVYRSRGQRISDPRKVKQNPDGSLEISPYVLRQSPHPVKAVDPLDYYKDKRKA